MAPQSSAGSNKHRPIQLRRTISRTLVAVSAVSALAAVWFAYESFNSDETSELITPLAAATAVLALAAMLLRRRTRIVGIPALIVALAAFGSTFLPEGSGSGGVAGGRDSNEQGLSMTITEIDCNSPSVVDGEGNPVVAVEGRWCVYTAVLDNVSTDDEWIGSAMFRINTDTTGVRANPTGSDLDGFRMQAIVPAGESITVRFAIDLPESAKPLTAQLTPQSGDALRIPLT